MPRLSLAALALALAPGLAAADTITGTVTYRERMMLPPDAVLEVQFQDTSLADAPAETLATYELADPGAPPYRFAFEYDPARIDESRSYTLRATIHRGDRLMMTTDTVYPVLTLGAGTEVDMLLRMVSSDSAMKPDSDIVNTYWKILSLKGEDLPVAENQREGHVILRSDGAYSATVGCNMIGGGYTLDGTEVTFQPGPTTLMACVPPLDSFERDLLEVLAQAARIEVDGEAMQMLDADGTALGQFRAVYF